MRMSSLHLRHMLALAGLACGGGPALGGTVRLPTLNWALATTDWPVVERTSTRAVWGLEAARRCVPVTTRRKGRLSLGPSA